MPNEQPQRDLIKETRELLSQASPGPWFWRRDYEMPCGEKHWALTSAQESERGRVIDASLVLNLTHDKWLGQDCPAMPNWQLIARAPELLRLLADEVERLQGSNENLSSALISSMRCED